MEVKSEIFSKRLIFAFFLNIVLQIFLAVGFIFIIQVDLLHPFLWITSTIDDIFGWRMGLNVLLLGLVSFFQAYIYGSYYMTPLPKYFTRFSMLLHMLSVQNAIFSILYALSGYFTMSLYSSLAKTQYNVLKKKCELYDGQCLLEQSLFLQFGEMWMGLYYFMSTHIFNTPMLLFPHIYQDKFQQIKVAVINVISMGFKNSVAPVAYYCVFYYMWGSKPRRVVADVYGLYLEDPPLDNIINLFVSGIWIGLWFYTSLFFISAYTMRTVFNIVLSEPLEFPIVSESALTLQSALAQRSQFNGYLGAQDLRILSMTDAVRRSQIFTLSQPGGHPRNWKAILNQCLDIITDFTKKLESVNGDTKSTELNNSNHAGFLNTTPQSKLSYSSNLRNMAQSPRLLELKEYNKNIDEGTFSKVFKEELSLFLQKLCQKPGISYMFGELSDTKLKYVLIQAQPVMWTCEGLSFIAAASLIEDKYGVVQVDLSNIISALVKLKQSLDKLTKPGLVPRKNILNDTFAIKMKAGLLSAVKRSIYKIVITFSKYIHEIPLEPEIQIAIQPFLVFKEA